MHKGQIMISIIHYNTNNHNHMVATSTIKSIMNTFLRMYLHLSLKLHSILKFGQYNPYFTWIFTQTGDFPADYFGILTWNETYYGHGIITCINHIDTYLRIVYLYISVWIFFTQQKIASCWNLRYMNSLPNRWLPR